MIRFDRTAAASAAICVLTAAACRHDATPLPPPPPTAVEVPTGARPSRSTPLDPTPAPLRGLRVLEATSMTVQSFSDAAPREIALTDRDPYLHTGHLAWTNVFAAAGWVGIDAARGEQAPKFEVVATQRGKTAWEYTVRLRSPTGEELASGSMQIDHADPVGEAPGREQITFRGLQGEDLRVMYDGSREVAVQIMNQLFRSPALLAFAAPKKPAAPQQKKKGFVLVVFDVEDSGKQFEPSTTNQLTDYLMAKIAEVGGYRVVPRDQLRQRLAGEKAESYKECFDQSCQIELGKALAAEKSLSTKLLRLGTACAMTATLFDLKTETTERAASARTSCDAAALLGGADQIAGTLTKE